MRTWTFPEVHPPPPGPWDDEPDKAQWVDDTTGLDCLIVRNRVGALCGYVGVPPGHPWHGVDYDHVDADVHGGLTFADRCAEGGEDELAIRHVPEPGRPADVWWLGFDCAHAWDLAPTIAAQLSKLDSPYSRDRVGRDVYRDFAYVQAECARLAAQVHEQVGV